ncbi:MAG: tRNA 2-thiouridine(34) synthase MnmA [Oscillospiraceae bacterium]|nr:tRNA 2-thiouridine(34) synthase MnmA [Oscillospiraceae bacterium]
MSQAMIAMSGGVDSSVAAYLTQQAGFSCCGATMQLHTDGSQDIEDARKIAERLHMPFHVFDLREDFRQHVIEDFIRCYEAGLTPNPCVTCNRHLKFHRFLEKARELGCDSIVTGHYARIFPDSGSGRHLLYKAVDETKDQSYFLGLLTQEQLRHAQFPLGAFTKEQARQIAEEQGFINARKRDSQDICFVPDGDFYGFIQRYTGKAYPEGSFLDLKGNTVGQHKGAVAYTLGQRKGLGIALGEPVYVCDKDMAANTVTVGPNEALYHKELLASNWSWFPFDALTEPMRVKARARSRMTEQPAWVYPLDDGTVRVVFEEPQRAITPGQAVVLYDGDLVIGGGIITTVLKD